MDKSLPSRGAWIEIFCRTTTHSFTESLPSRGAWIEMLSPRSPSREGQVAPLAGSVD